MGPRCRAYRPLFAFAAVWEFRIAVLWGAFGSGDGREVASWEDVQGFLLLLGLHSRLHSHLKDKMSAKQSIYCI